jgi:hypothetical protein
VSNQQKHPFGFESFTVTEEHIKLLRRTVISWNDCEFGAPEIDCKRPYGNSYVYGDIAEILGIKPAIEDEYGENHFSREQTDKMLKWHMGTQAALRIFLATGEMRTGKYECPRYSRDWRRVEERAGRGEG